MRHASGCWRAAGMHLTASESLPLACDMHTAGARVPCLQKGAQLLPWQLQLLQQVKAVQHLQCHSLEWPPLGQPRHPVDVKGVPFLQLHERWQPRSARPKEEGTFQSVSQRAGYLGQEACAHGHCKIDGFKSYTAAASGRMEWIVYACLLKFRCERGACRWVQPVSGIGRHL